MQSMDSSELSMLRPCKTSEVLNERDSGFKVLIYAWHRTEAPTSSIGKSIDSVMQE